jgi:hypothetical protein
MAVQLDNFMQKPRFEFLANGLISGEKVFVKAKQLIKKAVSPRFLLRRLSKTVKHHQKIEIADHINTSLEAHMLLANDEDADVRYALAENHNISRAVLNKLEGDSNPYVADRATKTLQRISANDLETISWRSCRTA